MSSIKRNTIQRQSVLNAVKELNMHATAEQVYEYVVRKHPAISKATVYRNLNQMSESGELLNIGNFHGSTRYDHNCHKHHHFVCEKCKLVFDVESDFSDIPVRIGNAEMFYITSYHLSFCGLCRNCKDGGTLLQ